MKLTQTSKDKASIPYLVDAYEKNNIRYALWNRDKT